MNVGAATVATHPLLHHTIYNDKNHVAVSLPFTDELQIYHPNGCYPLLEDPLVTKRAAIVGMFVLRPATQPLIGPITTAADAQSIYKPDLDWIFNVNGVDGGGLISNCNPVDGYRLAMQYALSDAVMFGSNIAANDGVSTAAMPGYLWQSYSVCSWSHMQALDSELDSKLQRNRALWQKQGYLSDRRYPAQIVISRTGKHYPGGNYFLQARMFHERHPTGEEIEVYIVTSKEGANRIRLKASEYNLTDRIESMLVILPPPPSPVSEPLPRAVAMENIGSTESDNFDISLLPTLLHDRFGMKIVNHDGGHDWLHEFYKSGSLCQMNITLCRNESVKTVLNTWPHVDKHTHDVVLSEFDTRIRYFFQANERDICDTTNTSEHLESAIGTVDSDSIPADVACLNGLSVPTGVHHRHGIPPYLQYVNLITDEKQEVVIVTFACNRRAYYFV